MKVAFQGERGAYSEQAVLAHFGPQAHPVSCTHLEDVFDAVKAGEVAWGCVPVENSSAGSIYRTYDLLAEHTVTIAGEHYLKVIHCLMGLPEAGLDQLETVYSHPQALDQCRAFLKQRGLQEVAFYDTAGAAKWVASQVDPGRGAIASQLAAKHYGLNVLADNIQTFPHNTTRFLVLTKEKLSPQGGPCKTSLVFETKHMPAALYKCLGGFATNGVNLSKLESRPTQTGMGRYRFYLDCEGHIEEPAVDQAVRELAFFTARLRVLGSYTAAKLPH